MESELSVGCVNSILAAILVGLVMVMTGHVWLLICIIIIGIIWSFFISFSLCCKLLEGVGAMCSLIPTLIWLLAIAGLILFLLY